MANGQEAAKLTKGAFVSLGLVVMLVTGSVTVAINGTWMWARIHSLEQREIPPKWFQQIVENNRQEIREVRAENRELRDRVDQLEDSK